MKQIIFAAINDSGEPLLDFAIRQGEIWTARKSTKLKVGDRVRLVRQYRGKHEVEGIVESIIQTIWLYGISDTWGFFNKYANKAGFSDGSDWLKAYLKINHLEEKNMGETKVIILHITRLRRLK